MINTVAVYGTLKQGHGNHRLLSSAELLGSGHTEEDMLMVSCGGFPAVHFEATHEESCPITVEVYNVDESTMQDLDWLEGYPNFYDRSQIEVVVGGDIKVAWMYHFNGQPSRPVVKGGNW